MTQLSQYQGVLTRTHLLTASLVGKLHFCNNSCIKHYLFKKKYYAGVSAVCKPNLQKQSSLASSHRRHPLYWKPKACSITAKMSTSGRSLLLHLFYYVFYLHSKCLPSSPLSQFCGRSGPSLEGPLVWTVVVAGVSRIYHRGFQRNGRSTRAPRHGGNWEKERGLGINMKWFLLQE